MNGTHARETRKNVQKVFFSQIDIEPNEKINGKQHQPPPRITTTTHPEKEQKKMRNEILCDKYRSHMKHETDMKISQHGKNSQNHHRLLSKIELKVFLANNARVRRVRNLVLVP